MALIYRRGTTAQHEGGKGIANAIKKKMNKKKGVAGVLAIALMAALALLNVVEDENVHRLLTQNLGRGRCKWSAPLKMEATPNPLNTTTLLASYPGSGKRLTWRLLEALTGTAGPFFISKIINFLSTILTINLLFLRPLKRYMLSTYPSTYPSTLPPHRQGHRR